MLKCNKKILKKLKQKKKGFTLLEIVVALAIVGIMMIPLGGALLTSVKANKMGEIKQESKLISQEIIEKIRSEGNVKESMSFNVGANKTDTINISKSTVNPGGYDVEGTLTDSESKLMVEGTINPVGGDFKEDNGSIHYRAKKFGLFVYVQNHLNSSKVSFFTSTGKTIDEYLRDTTSPVKSFNNCNELKIEIGEAGNKNKLVVNGETVGSLITTGSDASVLGEIGIYVEGQREPTDLVNLNLNNKNVKADGEVELYFFNNKFHSIGHDELTEPITDSFKRDRYINGEFKIHDNIKYDKESERLNKGLYSINLKFRKKIPNGTTVTESTQSEFMVDN